MKELSGWLEIVFCVRFIVWMSWGMSFRNEFKVGMECLSMCNYRYCFFDYTNYVIIDNFEIGFQLLWKLIMEKKLLVQVMKFFKFRRWYSLRVFYLIFYFELVYIYNVLLSIDRIRISTSQIFIFHKTSYSMKALFNLNFKVLFDPKIISPSWILNASFDAINSCPLLKVRPILP